MKNFIVGLIFGLILSGISYAQFLMPDNPNNPQFYFEFGGNQAQTEMNRMQQQRHIMEDNWIDPC